MRIAFDHQIFGLQAYGGVSRYAYELAAEFATTGANEVAVISPFYVNRYLSSAPPKLKVIGVPVINWLKPGLICNAVNSTLSRPALRYFRPDIVHETYYSSKRIAPKSAKVVLTVHDMIHEKFRDNFSRSDPTSRRKALAVERADHVICISEQTREDLIELLGVKPAKISVVHHGPTLQRTPLLERRGDSKQRSFLLYVGKRFGYKNFDRLLQVYATTPNLNNDFDLICFGGDEFSRKEKKQFKTLGLSSKRVSQAFGDDAALAEYYRTASAFVFPSLYEGFGMPPLEAMSFDCPVICSNTSSVPEVVGDAGEMFDPYIHDSIRVAIERVVYDNALQEDLIRRGQERIKSFSWKRCALETLNVYKQVMT